MADTEKCSIVNSKPEQHSDIKCEMCRRQKQHYTCDVCNTVLSTKKNIQQHLLEKCNGWNTKTFHERIKWKPKLSKDNKYNCPNCEKSFNRQTSLFNHMLVHDSDRPFKCNECGKQFKRKGTLDTHKRIHTGHKPYKCDDCSKKFRQQTALNNHKLVHAEVKPHICQFCYESFRQVSNLSQHIKKCHKTQNLSLLKGFVEPEPKVKKSLKLTFVTCASTGNRYIKQRKIHK